MPGLLELFEQQARQSLLNQALFSLITKEGGKVELPLDQVMDWKDMGGVAIEVDAKEGVLRLTAMDDETTKAFQESLREEADQH